MGPPNIGDTCKAYPGRSAGLGSRRSSRCPQSRQGANVSMLQIAINDREFCKGRKARPRDPWIAYT